MTRNIHSWKRGMLQQSCGHLTRSSSITNDVKLACYNHINGCSQDHTRAPIIKPHAAWVRHVQDMYDTGARSGVVDRDITRTQGGHES